MTAKRPFFTLIELLGLPGAAQRAKRSIKFTLIELLVVIGVIAILAGFLMPAALKMVGRSQVKATEAEMTRVRAALDEYYEDYGQYPYADVPADGQTWGIANAKLDERYDCELYTEGTGANKKWLDSWDTEIHYVLRNAKVMLISYGPDTTYGTVDDIEAR